ncbi:GMC family oxidoreductase N-terminal domain-containing protein [Nocardia sp. NPDC127606]|uniref:GMC family oxidoreductase N-terminal domain-containing protein n=1 Tax=Nocardia sp. NPDC127606 TaxID=3345406 RepID=UPI00362EDA05
MHARHEVVLCGGAVNSPQLLMPSGIGDRDRLIEYGNSSIMLPEFGNSEGRREVFRVHIGADLIAGMEPSYSILPFCAGGHRYMPPLHFYHHHRAMSGVIV